MEQSCIPSAPDFLKNSHYSLPVMDSDDFFVEEYRSDVLSHMLNMQKVTMPDPDMIELQPELEWQMRPYLLDFLVESHSDLGLSPETLFLTLNIIDRYSSKRVVYRRHYQLVGCTALWIAAKYAGKKHKIPSLKTLSLLCCSAYETHMFIQMESHILTTLGWCIGHPTCDLYIDYHIDQWNFVNTSLALPAEHMALYMCELAMFHRSLLVFPASTVAACAVNLSLLILREPVTDYSEQSSEYVKCLELLAAAICMPSSCLERKYSKPKFSCAYLLVEEFLAYRRSLAMASSSASTANATATAYADLESSRLDSPTSSFINGTMPTPSTPAGSYSAGYATDSPASFNDNDSTLTLDFEAVRTPTYATVQNPPEHVKHPGYTNAVDTFHPSKHSIAMYPYATRNPDTEYESASFSLH